jgi:hypothetical protein
VIPTFFFCLVKLRLIINFPLGDDIILIFHDIILLFTFFQGKYKVYNLCSERLYDASLLEGKVSYKMYFIFLLLCIMLFEISNLMLSDWVLFLTYPNLFGIKGFVVVVVVVVVVLLLCIYF